MAPARFVDFGLKAVGHAGCGGIAPGPVITAAGHEAHFERYPLHGEAVAVIFHFTEPIRPVVTLVDFVGSKALNMQQR